MKYFSLILLCLLGLSSCTKKDMPDPADEPPKVWLQFKLNGFPLEFKAGQNATYAATATVDDHAYERKFIFVMESEVLKKSVEIKINNYNDTLGLLEEDFGKTISTGTYKFAYSNAYPSWLPYRPKEINLRYIDDENNVEYCSALAFQYFQSSQAEFEILSVKDMEYEGKKYKLAEVRFQCNVEGSNKTSYTITEGHGFIPFGGI